MEVYAKHKQSLWDRSQKAALERHLDEFGGLIPY